MNKVVRFFKEEDGASMAEYGLLLALIAVVSLVVLTDLGTAIKAKFQAVKDSLG